jgi:hypothetical protein
MKIVYIIVMVAFLTGMMASVGLCKTDLIAAYSFDDGKAKDLTGNGNDGEIKDAKVADGKFGKAIEFDGTASQVVIKSNDMLNFKDGVTVEAWVKPTKYNDLSAVVQKWGDNTNRRQYLLCFVADKLSFYISGKGSTWPAAAGKTSVKTGEWTHIAGTYDLKTIKAYVNGKLDAETASAEGLFASDVPAWIGGYGPDADFGSNRHFPGVVDEVRYWNGALDENAINLNMNKSNAILMAVDANGKLATKWGAIKEY